MGRAAPATARSAEADGRVETRRTPQDAQPRADGVIVLYVVFGATFAVAFVLALRVFRTAGDSARPRLAAGVWALVAAVLVTAPVDAITQLVVTSAAA
jgi:hypothetical protein